MKRTPLKRGSSELKRTRLKPVSENRRKVNKARREALEARFGPRSAWKCRFKGFVAGTPYADAETLRCHGAVNGHETLSRARAGQTDANLLDVSRIVLLCNRHNEWVESNPEAAHEVGLALHAWEVE